MRKFYMNLFAFSVFVFWYHLSNISFHISILFLVYIQIVYVKILLTKNEKIKEHKSTTLATLSYVTFEKFHLSLCSSGTSSEWPQYHICKMSQIISLGFNFRRRSYDIFNISMDTHLYHDDHWKTSRYVDSL